MIEEGQTYEERAFIAENALRRLTIENERLSADLFQMIKTFHHYHINNGEDDSCKQCGLDLRHPVHFKRG